MRIEQESVHGTAEDTDGMYLLYAMPDGNQADSLANYLTRHGHEAVASGNEVNCPTTGATDAAEVFQLKTFWRMYWRYFECELYGLPCYVKPACADHVE